MSAEEGKPPVFRTWKGWYWVVMGAMLAQVFLYLWITYRYQ